MTWIELSLDTTAEAVDWVCTLLAEVKYTNDIKIVKYTESAANQEVQWAFTIHLYLADDFHTIACREIEQVLSPLQRTGLVDELRLTAPVETIAASPLVHRIGQKFVVLSPELSPSDVAANEITIKLKTSLAFGSGLHPATIAILQLLERHIVPEMNVLDLGSGSGILSVAMAKLGAQVLALDNDIVAVQSTQDAVERNQVEARVTVREGSLGTGSEFGHWMGGDTIHNVPTIQATGNFELIAANILARIHMALAPDYHQALRCAGLLIIAGFTADVEEAVDQSLIEVGFEAIGCTRLNEWVALAYRRKG
jgi:ribosomal protein L11 methyltransferase